MNKLIYIKEPKLNFGFNQRIEDPRDGLVLFGPYNKFSSYSIQAGVIGTAEGIRYYTSFVNKIMSPIFSDNKARPSFPGFETVFNIEWPSEPVIKIELEESRLKKFLSISNLHERTFHLVNYYLDGIKKVLNQEESKIDIWFVILPDEIWLKCRPKSASTNKDIPPINRLLQFRRGQKSIFEEMDRKYEKYIKILDSSSDFHDQFKARILQEKINIPVQIILEPTLRFEDKRHKVEFSDDMKAHLAWTQSSTVYYKLGKLPWKLSEIRDGVCYIGLVFKKYDRFEHKGFACSAAQMFLDSGDGTVFRGNIGPWKSKNRKEYHLDARSAEELLGLAIDSYREKNNKYPKEIFIHGRARFSNEEWDGFKIALETRKIDTKLVGVVIKESDKLKIYKDTPNEICKFGNLRGLALIINEKEGFLWTRGFVPRLNTSISLEIPNPLRIIIDKGTSELKQVLSDILSLTKLNYNACIYGDGLPVTLRFSDNVGNILTAVDKIENKVLPFKFYI